MIERPRVIESKRTSMCMCVCVFMPILVVGHTVAPEMCESLRQNSTLVVHTIYTRQMMPLCVCVCVCADRKNRKQEEMQSEKNLILLGFAIF